MGLTDGVAFGSGPIVNSNGFESPFTLGDLNNQQGWVTAGFGASTAVVQNTVVASGLQAVTVTRAAAPSGDRRWFVPQTGFPTQRFVTVDWDMQVEGPASSALFGPFFGVDTYDADSGVFVLGALGVDATTGDILIQRAETGFLDVTGFAVNFGEWNHFRMIMDFATDTYRGIVNDTQVWSSGFVDDIAGVRELDNFTDADIATFAAAGDAGSQALGGMARFDNFIIRDGLLGDYDVDGDVDTADIAKWQQTFGTAVSPAGNNADGNKNGLVDAADYVIWRENLGASLFSSAGSGSALSSLVVPEPSGLLLILTALLALVGRTFWRQQG